MKGWGIMYRKPRTPINFVVVYTNVWTGRKKEFPITALSGEGAIAKVATQIRPRTNNEVVSVYYAPEQ